MDFITHFGYLGIIVWTFLGAEEGVIFSGILASQGFFSLPLVILASAIGGSLGDQLYFYLAWTFGSRLLQRFDKLRQAYPKARRITLKYGDSIVLASRFLAGLRIAVSVACGLFKMNRLKYSVLNFISALMWATLFASLSYSLGRSMHGFSKKFVVLIGVGVAVLFLILRLLIRKELATEPESEAPVNNDRQDS